MKTFFTSSNSSILVLDYGKNPIPTANIQYIVGKGNYSLIKTTAERPFLSSFTLKTFRNNLKINDCFFIARKGLLINIDYLEKVSFENGNLLAHMKNGTSWNFSRRGGRRFTEHMLEKGISINGL